MQKTSRLISKQVHEKHPIYSLEFINTLNDYIFEKLKEKMSKAESLIYFLPPLGSFRFRLKETKSFVSKQINKVEKYRDAEMLEMANRIIDNYDTYREGKLNAKYERFGKETHEAYLLAKKEENLRKWKEAQFKQHSKLRRS